jgi:hypothetical protein
MGKQITFYMDRDDETEFVKFLRTTGDIAITPQTSREHLKEEFRNFTEAEGRPLGEKCLLWNRSVSPPPIVEYIQQQGYYSADTLQSEVVDVWRCKPTPQGLSMGRLWMEPKVLGSDGRIQSKNTEFAAWFAALSQWIKKKSVRVVDGAHVLPGADALARGGVELAGHVP